MAYITRQQAADRLSIGLRTLDGLIARGQLPAYKVGSKLVRLKESDIDEYMAARLVAPEPKKAKTQTQRPCRYVPGMKVV